MLPMLPETTKSNLERLWALTQRAQQLGSGIVAATAAKAAGREFSIVDAQSVGVAYLNAMQELARRPWQVAAYQQSLWLDVARAWTGAGGTGDAPPADRRFRDPKWEQDPSGRALRDAHLAIEDATAGLLKALPQGSKEQLRAEFYTRQLLSALAPSNFLMLNPAARDRFFETEGKSLIDGFENLLDDLEEDGRLDISTNDREAFVVGRDLATTPGRVVWQTPLMQLIQYEPTTETQHRRPLLFVPAWINKFYILDMRPKNSLVRYALDRGHTVFVISWINPGKEHAEMSFEDYMKHGPLAALDAIEALTGERQIDILGFCIGGILVTATLAFLAARGEDRIATATTLATMVDFTDVGEIGVFIDHDRLEALRVHMAETGYLENHHLQDMFSMIRENDLVWSFHVLNYLMGHRPPAFDLLYWNSDSTRLPAAMLLWYLEKIYIENGLRKPGHLAMDGTPIDIGKITTPCFVLATREDHIAPWTSVYPTTGLLGGEVRFVLGGSGHIAGVINPPAERAKYGYWVRDDYPPEPQEWLAGATHRPGSWWPYWSDWLAAKQGGERVPARHPGASKGRRAPRTIEPAPGSFVLAP